MAQMSYLSSLHDFKSRWSEPLNSLTF